ncbi:MAG TPA: class I SAM-dependent RNA methyltransferase [Anaeromyxobacteraceae bacterium]|nr:class I SAM-dependent RNA methyltransferase [Anaeromyxobacteraceae bacterium]
MRRTLTIDELAPGGEGVARDGARAVFVPFTAPGDEVEADVPAGEGPAHAELLAVVRGGPDRVAPPCRHFGLGRAPGEPGAGADARCGGCEWLNVPYALQLATKGRLVAETLRRIGKLEPGSYELRAPIGSPRPLRYRSRAKFHVDRGTGRLSYFRRRSHAPVRVEECHLLDPALDALRERLAPALRDARLAPNEVALEWSAELGRGAASLRLSDAGPRVAARAEALLAAVPELAGVVLEREGAPPLLAGDPVLRHRRDPDRLEAGVQRSRPDVFAQANRGANARLVATALELLAPDGADVLELYCGSGNFTAPLAARARSVRAVEGQGPALELARVDLTRATNVRFFAGDALAVARALAKEPGPRATHVLLDPPREGARGIGTILRELGAERVVYVSCDPATFARDLRGCVEEGFRVVAVVPVDMFPQTHHVECVGLVER